MNALKILSEMREEIFQYCDNNRKALTIIDRYIELTEHFEEVKKMNANTVTVTVKGKAHYFNGDELTSPEQQAIEFLKSIDKDALDE